eukprot:COSAG02_NODE_131_length_34710_cov_17.171159_7_plen_169_part_00
MRESLPSMWSFVRRDREKESRRTDEQTSTERCGGAGQRVEASYLCPPLLVKAELRGTPAQHPRGGETPRKRLNTRGHRDGQTDRQRHRASERAQVSWRIAGNGVRSVMRALRRLLASATHRRVVPGREWRGLPEQSGHPEPLQQPQVDPTYRRCPPRNAQHSQPSYAQ